MKLQSQTLAKILNGDNMQLMNTLFDILIIGSGPIGASTAYFLSTDSRAKNLRIGVVTKEPSDEEHTSTYKYAGGSILWTWPENPQMAEMTTETAGFVKELIKKGIDLSAHEDNYLLLHWGMHLPSLNIRGGKLVDHLLDEAQKGGVELVRHFAVDAIDKTADGYVVKSGDKSIAAKVVLVAVGAQLRQLVPDVPVEFKKRQLLVLDTPITEHNRIPHTVVPFGEDDGLVFFFIKKINDRFKLLLGQEDVLEYSDAWEEEDFYPTLVERGLHQSLPFLKDAKVEEVLWAFDYNKKIPYFHHDGAGLHAVVCGSAVRSSAYIGRTTADKLINSIQK